MGDFVFKMNDKLGQADQIVTCNPDIESAEIEPDWDFLILACDGIWDVLSNQEVVDFVTQRIGQAMEPEDICEELMTRCLSPDCQMGGLGCDNMTCVLVCLLQGKPYQVPLNFCLKDTISFVLPRHWWKDAQGRQQQERRRGEQGLILSWVSLGARRRLVTGTRQTRLRRRKRLTRRRAGRRRGGEVTKSIMNWQAPDVNIAGL